MPNRFTERAYWLGLWRWLLTLWVAGFVGSLSFPLAFPIGPRRELLPSGVLEPLAFVCLIPVLVVIRKLSPGKAWVSGFFAGNAFFIGAFWWVNVAMTTFGGMPNVLSLPCMWMLAAWCSLHWGLAFLLVRLFDQRLGWPMGWTIGPVWVATELLRNYLFSGFPWANLGYSQARNLWLSQIASLVGVYGVAFVVAAVNGALYEAFRAWYFKERPLPVRLLASAGALLVAAHIFGAVRMARWEPLIAAAERIRVAVVQGNIDQKLKSQQGSHASMVLDAYNAPTVAADAAGADLIVWPEGSFPKAVPRGLPHLSGVGLAQNHYNGHLLLGVDVYDPADWRKNQENAAVLLAPDLRVQAKYVKYHLVPFGEYVLFHLDRYLPIDNLVPGTFAPGTELRAFPVTSDRPGAPSHPVRVGITICFDAIFPEIPRELAADGAEILVNMTNDAWYGFSGAPFEFLRMVSLRAIETGKPVARAANTGISAFIDPLGRISQATPVGLVDSDELTLDARQRVPSEWRVAELPVMDATTVYVAIGDSFAYLCALFAIGGFGWAVWRGRRVQPAR